MEISFAFAILKKLQTKPLPSKEEWPEFIHEKMKEKLDKIIQEENLNTQETKNLFKNLLVIAL